MKVKEILANAKSNSIPISLYNKSFGTYLLSRLGPFSILWSSFTHKRETNSIVECHNKIVKNDIIRLKNLRPGRAIRDLRADTLAQLIKIRLERTPKCKKPKIPETVEEFKPRNKQNVIIKRWV